jgi:hypothetical protein
MGYCTWRQYSGGAVAAWIGTGTDTGKQVTVSYRTGSLGARDKTAACNDVRNQFCKKYGISGRCYAITTQTKCANTLWEQGISGGKIPLCADLTYPPDPYKGTGGLSTKGGAGAQTPAQRKADICAKQCGLDPICLYDKIKEECGGGFNPCSAFPAPFNDCAFVGLALAAFAIILVFKR